MTKCGVFVVVLALIGFGLGDVNGLVVPQHGSTIYLNEFINVELYHLVGDPLEVKFTVVPPSGHGVLVIIRTIKLRKGVPVIGVKECYEYVQFNTTDHSSFACGSINDVNMELVGERSFVGGINKSVSIKGYFTNAFSSDSGISLDTLKSTFILDITAYSDCSSPENTFPCSENMCISLTQECDGNYNCPTNDQKVSEDEGLCPLSQQASSKSTTKPLLTFDITSGHWPWNWGRSRTATTTTTTTEKPLIVIRYDDDDFNWWTNQMPFIIVIVIFVGISCIMFLMCSFLAKWNSRHNCTAEEVNASPLRGQELAFPNHYSIPAPQGRIYVYPECDNMAFAITPPPPAYQDEHGGDAPPSYNTLFKKCPPLLYASEAGTPPVHMISVAPVYDRAALNLSK